jgi:multidrug efflux pump subunit AcrB
MQRFNVSAWAIGHPVLIVFAMLLLTAAGAYSYLTLGRSEDPTYTVKVMIVDVAWPGATAREIETQVADKIEKKLQELPWLDHIETYSRPGVAFIRIVLKDSMPPSILKDLWYEARKKVGDIRGELPADVVGPHFNDEFGDVTSALYMLTVEGLGYDSLKAQAEDIRQRLLRVADVNKVDIIGEQKQRIYIEFSHAKLAVLGIAPQQIFDGIARQNVVTSVGSVDTAADRIGLHLSGAFDGAVAIADAPIEAEGRIIRLGDIATISRGYEDPPNLLVRTDGKPALGIGVSMQDGANILTFGANLRRELDAITANLPQGFEITQIADQPRIVDQSVSEFFRAFAEALVIVLLVGFVSLGMRAGIVVALSVPLVLAIVFVVMSIAGFDLNRITLGALIIALGLLVDDAIIAIEMMVVKLEEGFDRVRAATYAWTSTALPMLTGTLVTAAAFLPVGFAKSSSGEYAGGIFWIVGLALIASWIVAVVFTPYLGLKLLPDLVRHEGGSDASHHTRLDRRFRRLLAGALHWRKTVIFATAAMFLASIAAFGLVQQQFFPNSTRSELFFELRLPEGTSIQVTNAAAKRAETLIGNDPDVVNYTSYVGRGAPRFWVALNPVLPNPSFAQIVILTRDLEARERVKARLDKALAAGAIPEARTRVDRFVFGPPVGFPVQFRVIGPDPMKLRAIGTGIRKVMEANHKLIEPHFDWNEEVKSIQLDIDQSRARALGLTRQTIAQSLQTLLSGYTVTQLRDGTESIGIVARAVSADRLELDRLPSLTIVARSGVAVPLSQVAHLSYGFENPILWRRNRDRVLTARADIVDGVQAPDVSNELLKQLEPIMTALPPGYRIETGGSIEESVKANSALIAVFPAMLVAMLTFLIIQLQSFSRLGLVFATAPLGLIGATGALLVSSRPFGFVALLGMVALTGMIMRNTVILVDQIDQNIAAGQPRSEAIIDATARRARPVVLTALAAILGMIPLSSSVFWGPMAITIMGGLFAATILTLISLPAAYALWINSEPGQPSAIR